MTGGVRASKRGARVIAAHENAKAVAALRRTEREAEREEIESLRDRIKHLEREIHRARRCLATERMGRERLRQQVMQGEKHYSFAVGVLCRVAFPEDAAAGEGVGT